MHERYFIPILVSYNYFQCVLPCIECRTTPQGREYAGRISRTWTGKICQRWDSQIPHRHAYEEVGESANYCRNPDVGALAAPWCFTLDPLTRWQYCDVPRCGMYKEGGRTVCVVTSEGKYKINIYTHPGVHR